MHDYWTETFLDLPPVDAHSARQAREALAKLAKPPGALGRLEDLAAQLAAITRLSAPPRIERPHVIVFAGDHGVAHAHRVSAYPAGVTALMVDAIRSERACINALAAAQGAEVELIDVAVGPSRRTGDLVTEPAMSREQALEALKRGARAAREARARGVDLLCLGELGIGNTTPACCLAAALLGRDPKALVGPGAGLDAQGMRRKAQLVARALRRLGDAHGEQPDALTILSELGGKEHAAAAGCLLEAARLKLPTLIDGFILTSSALVALKLAPTYRGYALFATASPEPGHAELLKAFGAPRPLLDLGLRLGEGTGAALAIGLAKAASRLLHDVATLTEVMPPSAPTTTAEEPS